MDERERVVRCERYADVTIALFSGSRCVSISLSVFLGREGVRSIDDDDIVVDDKDGGGCGGAGSEFKLES